MARNYLTRIGERRVMANRTRFALINEIFGGMKDIKISQKEAVFQSRFEEASTITMKAQLASRIASQSPQFIIQACFFSPASSLPAFC